MFIIAENTRSVNINIWMFEENKTQIYLHENETYKYIGEKNLTKLKVLMLKQLQQKINSTWQGVCNNNISQMGPGLQGLVPGRGHRRTIFEKKNHICCMDWKSDLPWCFIQICNFGKNWILNFCRVFYHILRLSYYHWIYVINCIPCFFVGNAIIWFVSVMVKVK